VGHEASGFSKGTLGDVKKVNRSHRQDVTPVIRILTVLSLHVIISATAVCPAFAVEKTLQNDSFSGAGQLTCLPGFAVDEFGAARFEADPGDYPFTIKRIQVIVCPDGPPVELILSIREDDGSSLDPGPVLYEELATFTPSTTLINEVDLTLENIVVTSGSIRVGLGFFWGGSPPGLAYDADGILPMTNFVFVTPQYQWAYAESLGVWGDWIIRVVIEANDAPPIFIDGFESGDTTNWTTVVP
jgi:hypothetical protein